MAPRAPVVILLLETSEYFALSVGMVRLGRQGVSVQLIALSSGSPVCVRILANLCGYLDRILRHSIRCYHEGEL